MTSFDWVAIRYRNVIAVLKNPFYAGVYVYGKSEKRTSIVDDPGAEALRSPGFTRSDDALIDNNLAVFPFAASVNDIGFDRLERSYLAAFSDDAGQKARRRHRVEWGDRCAAPWMTRPNRDIDALSTWAYRKQDLGAVA